MKKLTLVTLAAAGLFFTQCKKENTGDGSVFNTNFYTTTPAENGKLLLYIDGNYKGELPYFAENPGCGKQDGDGVQPLNMQLKSGTYLIEGKDTNGVVKSSGEMFISKRKMSSSGGIGGQSVASTEECLSIGLME